MKALSSILAITTLAGGVAAALFLQQLQAERLRSDELQNRVTELELALARQPAPAPRPDSPAAASATGTAAGQSGALAAAALDPQPASAGTSARVAVSADDLMKDPDFRASVEAQLRQSIGQAYPDLARELELSPDQARKLLDILATNTMSTITMASDGQGNTRIDTRGREASQAKRDDEIRALLGDSKLQLWKDYEQSMPARQQVVRLRTTLEAGGASLSQRQQQQLITAMAGEQKRQAAEVARTAQVTGGARNGPAAMEQMLQLTEEGNRRILDAALAFLNPQQLDALKAQQNMDLAGTRAVIRAQRPQSPASGAPPATAPAPAP